MRRFGGDRSRERPLRNSSKEKEAGTCEKPKERQVFQSQEEQDAHLRRLRLLADTAPKDKHVTSGETG